MMLTLIALVQSALACGPYFPAASSEDGAVAFSDENNQIVLYTADKEQRIELPIFGDVIDMDFVGSELVVAFGTRTAASCSSSMRRARTSRVEPLPQHHPRGTRPGPGRGRRRDGRRPAVHIRLTDDPLRSAPSGPDAHLR